MLIFDVKGFFGHFRKHYSTTSSLSYAFPPRTTIAGMIAAMLGYGRDSYYSLFSSDRSRIALQIRSPVRRSTNTLNYLMTDRPLTLKKLRGMEVRAIIRVDTLLSGESRLEQLVYRIFFNHVDGRLLEELTDRARRHKFAYPPSLGTANNLAEVEFVDYVDAKLYRPDGEVEVSTVIPLSMVKKIYPQEDREIFREESVPAEFDENRKPKRLETYVYEGRGRPLKVLIDGEVFECAVDGGKVVGVFM